MWPGEATTGGAEWVLRYLDTAPRGRSWGSVRRFEVGFDTALGRREVDVLLKDGMRLQLKSWLEFRPDLRQSDREGLAAVGQAAQRISLGFRQGEGPGQNGAIRAMAEQALLNASAKGKLHMSAADMQTLIDNLGTLIVVR